MTRWRSQAAVLAGGRAFDDEPPLEFFTQLREDYTPLFIEWLKRPLRYAIGLLGLLLLAGVLRT